MAGLSRLPQPLPLASRCRHSRCPQLCRSGAAGSPSLQGVGKSPQRALQALGRCQTEPEAMLGEWAGPGARVGPWAAQGQTRHADRRMRRRHQSRVKPAAPFCSGCITVGMRSIDAGPAWQQCTEQLSPRAPLAAARRRSLLAAAGAPPAAAPPARPRGRQEAQDALLARGRRSRLLAPTATACTWFERAAVGTGELALPPACGTRRALAGRQAAAPQQQHDAPGQPAAGPRQAHPWRAASRRLGLAAARPSWPARQGDGGCTPWRQ